MKRFIGIQLAIFFISAGALYLYAHKLFGAERKSILDMTAQESYIIWDAVNKIEESWYVKEPMSVEVVPLDQQKYAKLKRLVAGYEELEQYADELIKARQAGDLQKFLIQKEKIAQQLRPIWSAAMREEKELQAGWLAWIKNNIRAAMNRTYIYFFSGEQKK